MEHSNSYAAFISYRHCPLDIKVAETLHKMIERYQIPKELRTDSKKNIGRVFRDRDELPLSNNLTGDIYNALDRSKYLIVICTPDTPKSQWVDREIEYFISKHGRSRVLTLLVSGTPEESVPARIACDFAENGDGNAKRTTVSASVVDTSEKEILKKLKTEYLHLAAAMLHCTYDTLLQHQKRYRMQQITTLTGIAAALAVAFVLVLGNRNQEITLKNQEIIQQNEEISKKNEEISAANQQITHQLKENQTKESQALALLSQQQLADGDRFGAIESALNALPHDGEDRPYVADAQSALANALHIYDNMWLEPYKCITQDTEIHHMTLSDDGHHLITMDEEDYLRCFDTRTGEMLWLYDVRFTDISFLHLLEVVKGSDVLLYSDNEKTLSLSLRTGKLLNQIDFRSGKSSIYNTTALSPDGKFFVQCADMGGTDANGNTQYLDIYNTANFEWVNSLSINGGENYELDIPAFSVDNKYLAFGFVHRKTSRIELWTYNTETWEACYKKVIAPSSEGVLNAEQVHLAWTPEGELLLFYAQRVGSNYGYSYGFGNLIKFDINGNTAEAESVRLSHTLGVSGNSIWGDAVYDVADNNYLGSTHHFSDNHVYFVLRNYGVICYDYDRMQHTGYQCDLDYHQELISGSYLRGDGTVMIMCEEGSIYSVEKNDKEYTDLDVYQHQDNVYVAAGAAGRQELLCLVSSSAPNTAILLLNPINALYEEMDASQDSSIGSYYLQEYVHLLSPSGNTLLVMREEDLRGIQQEISLYDVQTLTLTDRFIIESDHPLVITGFSADEKKLYFEDLVCDLSSHSLSVMENGEAVTPPLYTQSSGQPLLRVGHDSKNLYWWTDESTQKAVSIPGDSSETQDVQPAVGYCGLAAIPIYETSNSAKPHSYGIFSLEDQAWKQLPNPCELPGLPAFTVGQSEKRIAFADYDQMLRIYDYEQNTIVNQFPLPVSSYSITGIQYIAQDRYLLFFTALDYIHLIDANDGTEIGSFYYIGSNDPGTVYLQVDENMLYLYGSSNSRIIELTNGAVWLDNPNIQCYLPSRNQLIRASQNSLTAFFPLSGEHLIEAGKNAVYNTQNYFIY